MRHRFNNLVSIGYKLIILDVINGGKGKIFS